MLVWLIFAVMTAAALMAMLRPLAGRGGPVQAEAGEGPDTAIYRDQLDEVEADLARGLITEAEAEGARIEISRRLIAAADAAASAEDREHRLPGNIAVGLGAVVTLIAVGIYLIGGKPWLQGQPLAERVAASMAKDARVSDLIAMVEKRLREHPEDGRGWDVIAPVYMTQGRFRDAANAYTRAGRILGESPGRLAGLAQATILANDGVVTETARKAYENVLTLSPEAPEPRFWIAVAKEQDGKLEEAARDFTALLEEAPADAKWRPLVVARLDGLKKRLGVQDAPRGPTAADAAAAQDMSAGERGAMIENMVAGLAARLKEDGRDVEGWKKLMRSYMVLGQREKALAALAEARKGLAGNAKSLAAIEDWARQLGLQS
ncbi:MAG: Cytochrome c-type biosis protein CycH [Pseudomonadota bacterium]|jgi:cytochrome c-type biogenesis protein CcmH